MWAITFWSLTYSQNPISQIILARAHINFSEPSKNLSCSLVISWHSRESRANVYNSYTFVWNKKQKMLFPMKPLWIDLLRDKVTPCPSPFIPQHILVWLGLFSPHPFVDTDIGNINIDISIYWYWHYNPLGVGEYWYCSRHPLVKILILAILTIHSYPFLNSLSLEPAPEPALAKNISLLPNNAHSDYFFYITFPMLPGPG